MFSSTLQLRLQLCDGAGNQLHDALEYLCIKGKFCSGGFIQFGYRSCCALGERETILANCCLLITEIVVPDLQSAQCGKCVLDVIERETIEVQRCLPTICAFLLQAAPIDFWLIALREFCPF